MFTTNSKIFISTCGFAEEFTPDDIRNKFIKKEKNVFVLSLFDNAFDYSFLTSVSDYKEARTLMHMIIVNPVGKTYELFATPDQKLLTLKRGYQEMSNVNLLDVLLDVEDRLCKVVKKELLEFNDPVQVCNMTMTGTACNFFLNGVLAGCY
jgi:hypothetical protein